jgi:hypothetical protein
MDEIDHIWEKNRQLTDKAQEAPRSGSAQSRAAVPERSKIKDQDQEQESRPPSSFAGRNASLGVRPVSR